MKLPKLPHRLNKECFWRHGAFTDVKILVHEYNAKGNKEWANYKVKRIITVQKCNFCGKLIMRNSA